MIDADHIGHQLLQQPAVQAELVAAFGERIRSAAGGIDRAALAATVFGPGAEQTEARERLESILHPRIAAEVNRRIGHCDASVQFVLLDAALLLEAGWREQCDALVFIDSPRHLRLDRVRQTRGWDANELLRRESAQMSPEEKRSYADVVIDNSNDLSTAAGQLHSWLAGRLSAAPDGSPAE